MKASNILTFWKHVRAPILHLFLVWIFYQGALISKLWKFFFMKEYKIRYGVRRHYTFTFPFHRVRKIFRVLSITIFLIKTRQHQYTHLRLWAIKRDPIRHIATTLIFVTDGIYDYVNYVQHLKIRCCLFFTPRTRLHNLNTYIHEMGIQIYLLGSTETECTM